MPSDTNLNDLVASIATRAPGRTEAMLQADIRQLLLSAPIGLADGDMNVVTLEAQVGDRRRIDIEVGSCVIEVKRDLGNTKVMAEAVDQLRGYVETRTADTGLRYVGILTDGARWSCYHLSEGGLREASGHTVGPGSEGAAALVAWLDGVLATAREIPPTPENIRTRLGAGSSAYDLERTTLTLLYDEHGGVASVVAKRRLWARLLTTALGTHFEDDDELFVQHSLLVLSAEVIAHAVLGITPEDIPPRDLVSGVVFDQADVFGAVEPDFFDWVVEVPRGEQWIRSLSRRLSRFTWRSVDHDVLKILYESVIPVATRKKLGEYYTPDWLAECVVDEVVADPTRTRVLDPACGSGTFLFHAVRRYLAAADDLDISAEDALKGVTDSVVGMDLHPVAVTLARVTYLLAIGTSRLNGPRGPIRVPVYLGDSLKWQMSAPDLWSQGNLAIRTDSEPDIFESELLFPEGLLEDPDRFDGLVDALARRANERPGDADGSELEGILDRFEVDPGDRSVLQQTYAKLCHLSDEGRDHIWSYYVRNLARPSWISQPENRVDALLGNPPWLAYRYMTTDMQEAFRSMSSARGLWEGATVATHQDLSALFVVRAIELYLRPGGVFGMVMPNAALDRAQFRGFRAGNYGDPGGGSVVVAFDEPWDLRRLRPHFFPRGAAVVFGSRASKPAPMPKRADSWQGRIPPGVASWSEVATGIVREVAALHPTTEAVESRYREQFTQGATPSPRMVFIVEPDVDSPLGTSAGMVRVRSLRSATEKEPWKSVPDMAGVLEERFVRPLYSGESILPYRALDPLLVVVPADDSRAIDTASPVLDRYPGLRRWWREAESIWEAHRSSDRLTLMEQLDYRGKLSAQLNAPPDRVVYSASGMHMAAARISKENAIVSKSLYWAPVSSEDEALYLCGILNSAALTQAVRPLMSYGKDERHFDKYVWQLGIPEFDGQDGLHQKISECAEALEVFVSGLDLSNTPYFVTARKAVRSALAKNRLAQALEAAVEQLLDVL